MKRLLVLSVGLLASASIFGDNAPSVGMDMVPPVKPGPGLVAAPKLIAPAPIAILATPQAVTCEKHAPYSDIASVMQDDGVLSVIGSLPTINVIKDPIYKLGEAIKRAEKLDIDLCKLVQAGSDTFKKLQCLKAGDAKRQGSKNCAAIDCGASRIACIVKALENVKKMLEIISRDFFIGYQDGNKKVDGMIYLMLDVVGQKNAGDLKTKVDPILEKALNVIGVIEDLLKKIPASTISEAAKTPVAEPAKKTN